MIGKQILNYEIKSILGEGGMGTVYLAEHLTIHRKVAIKVLKPEVAQKEEIRKRFKNEASLMAHLQHPNIVGLIDYLEQEDGLYLIMEYVDGRGLDEVIKDLSQPFPIPRATEIFKKVLAAFAYAHKNGIIHRDVKPSNILITSNDEVKVLDFGIAKLVGETQNHLTKTGTHMGTVYYMSPEQVKAEQLDQRSDIYSLGITFYELLAGFCPYANLQSEYEVYNQIVKEPLVPLTNTMGEAYSKVWKVIFKAIQKNKFDRFASCDEMINAMNSNTTLKEQPVYQEKQENSKPIESNINEKPKKNYTAIIIIGIIILLSSSYFVWDYLQKNSDTTELVAGEKVWVIKDELIFRDTTNSNAQPIITAPFGAELELLEEPVGPFQDGKFLTLWQKAKYNDQIGWIAVQMDSQNTVGTEKQFEEMKELWGGEYNSQSEYALMRRWAQYVIRDNLKSKGWTGKYRFKFLSKTMKDYGYRTILKYHFDSDFEDKERFDYVVMLESTTGNKNLVYFCKADRDGQGGIILGKCFLPTGSSYFSYTKDEYGNDFDVDEIIIHNQNGEVIGYLNDDNYSVYYQSKYYYEEGDEYIPSEEESEYNPLF